MEEDLADLVSGKSFEGLVARRSGRRRGERHGHGEGLCTVLVVEEAVYVWTELEQLASDGTERSYLGTILQGQRDATLIRGIVGV